MSEEKYSNSHGVWWKKGKGEVHEEVVGTMLDIIAKSDSRRREDLAAWRCMYMDYPMSGDAYKRIGFERIGKSPNNVLTGAIESTIAKLISSPPKPEIVSVGGDWDIRQRVKLMNQWSSGQWERLRLHPMMAGQVQEAAMFGTGVIKFSPRFGAPYAESVWCGHLWVDPREEFHKCVRTLYQYAGKDREELAEAYPEYAEQILNATKIAPQDAKLFEFMPSDSANTADLVAVVEAWRLPVRKGGEGRHVICVDGVDLLDEPWPYLRFPFSFMKWGVDPFRFWGQGMVERGAGPQSELNELCRDMRESYEKWFPCWLVPKGSTMPEKVSDEIGGIWAYDPSLGPPQYYTPPAVGAEITNQVYSLENRTRATIGVSDMDSAGVEARHEMSGKARLVKKDSQSIRFGREGQAYEQACVDCQEALMLVADYLADSDDSDLDVYDGDRALEHIEFGRARLKKDTVYRVRVEPISKMADSLTGKLEQVGQMMESGIITDKMRAERLLGIPDLVADGERSQSSRDIVDRAIGKCLDGEPTPAHTYMDTEYAVTNGIKELNLAEIQGAPEESMEHLRNFIGHAMSIREKKQQAEAAAMAPPAPPAMGDPTQAAMGPAGMPPAE